LFLLPRKKKCVFLTKNSGFKLIHLVNALFNSVIILNQFLLNREKNPYAIYKDVELKLEELQRDRIITLIKKSDWELSLVSVPKPDEKIRFCVDYKVAVNLQLMESHYLIPRIEELIQNIKESNYYCKLDLYKAYLHVEVDEESQYKQRIKELIE